MRSVSSHGPDRQGHVNPPLPIAIYMADGNLSIFNIGLLQDALNESRDRDANTGQGSTVLRSNEKSTMASRRIMIQCRP